MTRINANIPPAKLIDQHLLAEYREMVRIPSAVKKYIDSNKKIPKIPNEFKLGKGHVLYFYDKLKFLHNRFNAIKQELDIRKTANNMSDEMFFNLPDMYYNDIDKEALDKADILVTERIIERINGMNTSPKYFKKDIDVKDAINMLLK